MDSLVAIKLDDLTIYEAGYSYISIEKEFTMKAGKIALFQLNSGGTACPAEYMLVIAKYNSLPLITTTFGNCSDLPEISFRNNVIIIDFPGNPSETWIWDNNYRLYKNS